jgi:hypothetical protein
VNRKFKLFLVFIIALYMTASAYTAFALVNDVSKRTGNTQTFYAENFCRSFVVPQKESLHIVAGTPARQQRNFLADETSQGSSQTHKKVAFDRRHIPASDERILSLSKAFTIERFLRAKSITFIVLKQALLAMSRTTVTAFSKFTIDPPAVLLLPTQIAVRK